MGASRPRIAAAVAGHVNNAAYWEPVEELFLERGEPVAADLEIEFREPARAGEVSLIGRDHAMWIAGEAGTVHASIVGVPGSASG
jgi:hypothetical protein